MPPPPQIGEAPLLDVAIVGAGQGGLAAAFALGRERVTNVAAFDRSTADAEGPWENFARMPALRTPKYLTGPDCGIPSLTFRAWYEARGLDPEWETLERIPRPMWMEYLRWLRRVMGVRVENGTEVTAIEGDDEGFVALRLVSAGVERTVHARQVIVANGIDGGGAWTIPPALCRGLPREFYAHTSDSLDPRRLRGRRVAVLGIGAAALDCAAFALDADAAEVTLSFRRPAVPVIEVRDWIENAGFLRGFGDLPDAERWAVMRRLLAGGAPPPAWSLERCTREARFRLLPATPWRSTRWTGEVIEIDTPQGMMRADFLIFGTGAVTRLDLRPELRRIAPHAALWRDAFAGAEWGHPMAEYPYLGPSFEVTERVPGTAPWLSRIRLFNWAATASLGICAASITGMKTGLDRLIPGVVRALYAETAAAHIARMPWPDRQSAAPE